MGLLPSLSADDVRPSDDVIAFEGLTTDASYIAWYGEDKDCGGDDAVLISRGFSLEKAGRNPP